MSDYYLFQDSEKCIGCHSCEVACKVNKNLTQGPRPCRVIGVGPRSVGGVPRTAYVFMSCFHCENPWCVAACPTGAMQKREKDGIVFVDPDLCVGCKACIASCPWSAPQWNPETGKVVKCDYCMDRIDQGLKPACVTVCTTQCLHFGKPDEMPNIRQERHARKVAVLGNIGVTIPGGEADVEKEILRLNGQNGEGSCEQNMAEDSQPYFPFVEQEKEQGGNGKKNLS
ncbi:4Fe-4S ferredoxin [Desulfonema ishimotonii]|uniref:4Fe-4S ferredoxin n=1 Tax=Desulfonema ishimotonii TaxID=45657 RepID=A0A401FUZ4_9BACT|nr:4Fe-4S dicluster domain-containing protein [Desulfonema ishimotonii]GBC60768.1 4Fe-4S ferredoxin [Desulfonema ishimotonii]